MISIRVNTLVADADTVLSALQAVGTTVERVPWNDAALIVRGIAMRDLTDMPVYHSGAVYVQSLPSMIPALALGIAPEMTVLDLCAAPGSKTTQMAALMHNTGTIIANDISRDRLFKLKANSNRMHVSNVVTSLLPGAGIWRKYPNYFDAVLADVPCSMGQTYAPKNLKMLVSRQKKLIRAAYSALKPGAYMVYSTCSPRIEENENVVEYLLRHESGARLVPIAIPHLPADWIAPSGTVRMLAHDEHEDFFVALIHKTDQDEPSLI